MTERVYLETSIISDLSSTMNHPGQDIEPWKDEIVAEVRSAPEQLFAACGFDLQKLAERLRRDERERGRSAVSYPKRAPAKTTAS